MWMREGGSTVRHSHSLVQLWSDASVGRRMSQQQRQRIVVAHSLGTSAILGPARGSRAQPGAGGKGFREGQPKEKGWEGGFSLAGGPPGPGSLPELPP